MRGVRFQLSGLTANNKQSMATLSQMCVLPEGWGTPSISEQIGMSKRSEWLIAKRKQHERLMAYRERERIRAKRHGVSGSSIEHDRQRVRRETMAETMGIESRGEIFNLGKGERSPKKAKNRASREQAGTIGRSIVVKRFEGSRLTCVCKSVVY